MAFVSFLPAGSQIDRDSIQDKQLNVDDKIVVSFELDTTGLSANLQSIDIQVDVDTTEVNGQSVRTEADETAFPDFVGNVISQEDGIVSIVFERDGPPGAMPDTIKVIVETELTALTGLKNDGEVDLGITVVKAIDVDGKDVTHLFEPSRQSVDIQPFPIVGVTVDKTSPLSEANEDSGTFIITLNEPAPIGGLLVNFDAVDSDGIPGDVRPSTVNGTLQLNKNGSPSGILIDEGVTEARITLTAVPDDILEGEEISGLDLLPGNGYAIDAENNSASFIVTDLPIVTFSVDRTVISEGGESQLNTFELSKPAPEGGLTLRLVVESSDGKFGDVVAVPELFNNINPSDAVVVEENGLIAFEVTILPGATSATFGLQAPQDNLVEGKETFTFTLLDGEDYSIDPSQVAITTTIIDKDVPIVSFSVDRTVISEGGEPQLNTFELSKPAPEGGLTVRLRGEDSDRNPLDPVPAPELFNNINPSDVEVVEENGFPVFQFTILPGATSATFGLAAPEDNLVEGDETFTLTLLDDENYSIDPAQVAATTTIIDKDLPIVSFSVDRNIISEGEEKPQIYTLQLNEPAPNDGLTVKLQFNDPDGDLGDGFFPPELFNNIDDFDFSIENSNLVLLEFTISPGATAATFGLLTFEDNKIEGDETFTLTLLDDESYSIDPAQVAITTTIIDKELPIVSFSVDRNIISEGEEKPQIFTLQLNEPAPDDGLTVKLQLEDPDGDLGDGGFPPELFNNIDESNFVVENGNFVLEFTISTGATEATFSFLTGEDNKIEGDETFTLTLLDDESYSIDPASVGIVTTITEKEVINGTPAGEKLFGTDASQFIIGFAGNDTIFGNGGEDNLIGDEGDDLIYGGSQADTILGGEGNDTIFANGGGDLINSGTGEDIVWLGDGKATVILETGEGFDIVNNFQLGATTFQVESTDNISFTDSVDGAKIFQGDDLLAIVSSQLVNTFIENQDSIFIA